MDDATLIDGLLAKCLELHALSAELREKVAVVSDDIEAVNWMLNPSATVVP